MIERCSINRCRDSFSLTKQKIVLMAIWIVIWLYFILNCFCVMPFKCTYPFCMNVALISPNSYLLLFGGLALIYLIDSMIVFYRNPCNR